ncbi:sugar ABC transporter substrate-binding protein [Protaetiibacter intestinalis]|uniref:Sugar ABC transporter substrate-binding protein n=1 Tax=Protaetiibacter intestinalis TaxID=2419774 RepID=A0A387BD51_9MICO|nr:sugar ABC transporter substrate-binding protein [Protaetiibacter intestinalis]AYF98809.1 sugar ABC transporter substrate-binding protein [Protaetiibacter intestinalis]
MKRILALAAAVGLAVGLTACSEPAGGGGASDDGTKTIGVVALVATDALNAAVIQGVTEVAEENGWKVHVTDTNGSVEAANAAMITYSTTQKMDAIAVMAFQTNALQAGLQSAQAADIPVVSWGGELGAGIVATTSARAVGQDSIDALLDDFGDEGAILALTYHTGVLCLYRGYAFDDTVAPLTSLNVTRNEVAIPGQVEDGTRFTSAWLASNPEGSGPLAVWGAWDEPAIGAVAALQQSGRDDVRVYSINGGPQALQAVKDGTIRQVVWQDGQTEGAEMMQAAVDYLAAPDGWDQKTIDVPGVVVTADNIDQFLTEHPNALNP